MNKEKYEKNLYKNNICNTFLNDVKKELANLYSLKFQNISPIDNYLKSVISLLDKIIIVLNKLTNDKRMYFDDITKISKDITLNFIDNIIIDKNYSSKTNSASKLQNSFSTSNLRLLNKTPSSFIYNGNKPNNGSKIIINRKSEKKNNTIKTKKSGDNRNLINRSKLFSTSNNIKSSISSNFTNKSKNTFIKKKCCDLNNILESKINCKNVSTIDFAQKNNKAVNFNILNKNIKITDINSKKLGKQGLTLDNKLTNSNKKSNINFNNKCLIKENLISIDNPIRKVKNIILKSHSNSNYNKTNSNHFIETQKNDKSNLRNFENYENDSGYHKTLINDDIRENSFSNLFGLVDEKKYLITEEKDFENNKFNKNKTFNSRKKDRDCNQILFDCMENIKVRLNKSKDKKKA